MESQNSILVESYKELPFNSHIKHEGVVHFKNYEVNDNQIVYFSLGKELHVNALEVPFVNLLESTMEMGFEMFIGFGDNFRW